MGFLPGAILSIFSRVMDKLRASIIRFMSGRYGADKLYNASIAACLVLMVANLATRSIVVGIAMWALMGWTVFRAFSKNGAARRRELDAYLRLTARAEKRFAGPLRRIRGIRSYRYRRCPGCKALIELPLRRGKRTISCPRCRQEFEVSIRI